MTAAAALLRYWHETRAGTPAGTDAQHLFCLPYDEGGSDAQSAHELLVGAAPTVDSVPDELLCVVLERNLARLGQALARHPAAPDLAQVVASTAEELALSRRDEVLEQLRRSDLLPSGQLDALAGNCAQIARAWYGGYPPLLAWRDVEELVRLAVVRERLQRIPHEALPKPAATAYDAACRTTDEVIAEIVDRLSQWIGDLTADELADQVARGRPYPDAQSRPPWSAAYWLLMIVEALEDSDALSRTAALEPVTDRHRSIVEKYLGRAPSSPVIALPEGPWLNAAADAELLAGDDAGVGGNCWRGHALLLPAGVPRALMSDQGELNGALLHELVEDIQADRPQPHPDSALAAIRESLREGATELLTHELLQAEGHPLPDESLGYPFDVLLVDALVDGMSGEERRDILLELLESEDPLTWLLGDRADDPAAQQQALEVLQDALEGARAAVGFGVRRVARSQLEGLKDRARDSFRGLRDLRGVDL